MDIAAAAAAKSRQSCLTLCDPIDGSPPGSCVWDSPGKNTGVGCHFLLQCIKWKVKVKLLSRVQLFATPWTAAHQAPLSMGFSRQEYWSGVPLSAKHWWILIGWIILNAGNSLSKASEAHFFPYSLCGELVYHAWLSDGSWDGGLPSAYWFSFSGGIVTRFTYRSSLCIT